MKRANGEGSIYKRGTTGRWAAQYYVTMSNGGKKRICVTGKTREIVKEKLRAVIDRDERHLPYDDKDWSLADYMEYWMRSIQASRVRDTTIRVYDWAIKNHIMPVLGQKKLRSLSVPDIRQAIIAWKERGSSARTAIECVRVLTTCLNCAMREELIFRNVAQLVERPKHTPEETVIWTAQEAVRFLEATEGHPEYIAFLLLMTYGMRKGEVLGLRYSDIDFERGFIHIRQQISYIKGKLVARDLKTESSRRTLPLASGVRDALAAHAQANHVTIPPFNPSSVVSKQDLVLTDKAGNALDPQRFTLRFHVLTQAAGLPRIKVHALRHTAATMMKNLNIPVKDAQMILGHSNITTTLSIYQHGSAETQRSAISAMQGQLKYAGTASGICKNVSNNVSSEV